MGGQRDTGREGGGEKERDGWTKRHREGGREGGREEGR